jgi:hypothetical protein
MILFGLWHKASVLFILWGCYHGVLLVLHRQVQGLQRKFNWTPSAPLWTPISWLVTISFVSLGWIFFRAHSLLEARQMLRAVLSPSSYSSHFLSGSLYGLVASLAAGYAMVLLVIEVLDCYSFGTEGPGSGLGSGIIAVAARNRWFWIPPLYVLLLLLVVVVTHTGGAGAAQFMYRRF